MRLLQSNAATLHGNKDMESEIYMPEVGTAITISVIGNAAEIVTTPKSLGVSGLNTSISLIGAMGITGIVTTVNRLTDEPI